jgi:putative ABC transport system permease protein
MENVDTVVFNDESIQSYREMLKSVDMVMGVLVVSAATLAFVVLYNLTNINIEERKREIASLKVLGFTKLEVCQYVFREILIIVVIGALTGLVVGYFFEGYVVVTAEVNRVMFGRSIHLLSYIYSFGLTLVFSVIVMFAMMPKLAKIDMVESLKSIE